MNIRIQYFTMGLFILFVLISIGVWSLSLYLVLAGNSSSDQAGASFLQVWLQQSVWVIPLLLIMGVIVCRLMYLGLIRPLLSITREMQDIVIARHPGHEENNHDLTYGLKLLRHYFVYLTHLATHDPLTGLNNRVIFEEHLSQAILNGKRSGRKYALVLIRINGVNRITSELGLYIGDELMRQIANRMTTGLRGTDSTARLEKNNFALLLEYLDSDQVNGLVYKINSQLTQGYRVYERNIEVAIHIGAALYPDHGQDVDSLFFMADRALLKAKKEGSAVEFFQQSSAEENHSGFTLVQSLHKALDRDEFKLVYQPVIDLENHETHYFEALLRWKHSDQKQVSIEQIIESAEKNQLIKPLTNWLIETVCQQINRQADESLKIAINLSMIDFHDDQLPERIRESLERHNIKGEQLLIEITEGQIMRDPNQVVSILNHLSDMNISLLIDDFGTGQASLTYLKNLPVEKLKIDQSFVKDMDTNKADRTIVQATIMLAHTLGIKVVAEGVESAGIHDLLSSMACDYVQGYYISRPFDQDQIMNWCRQNGTATHLETTPENLI